MAEITIGRFRLKLSGLSDCDGDRLVRLVAEGLAMNSMPIESSRHLDTMRVDINTPPGSSADELSKHIVADLIRQLDRSF